MELTTSRLKFLLSGIFLIALFGVSFWLSRFLTDNETVQNLVNSYGYFAALLVGVIAGFNFIVPLPAIAFMPVFLAAHLNAFVLAILLAIGMTVADGVEYAVSKSGWETLKSSRTSSIRNRLDRWKRKHPVLPIAALFFYTAFAPAPNELSLPLFASLGYKTMTIMATTLPANALFNIVYGIGLTAVFHML